MNLFLIITITAILCENTAILAKNLSDNRNSLRPRMARRKVFVDTSVLIDGRILSIAKTGFLGDEILIPRSVIRELQLLADGNDADKRNRARFGLDIVNSLERVELAEVEVHHDSEKRQKVDERLLDLARENRGIILTNDYNLKKVAATEKITAISVNELAQSLRSEYLPGDRACVRIIDAGSNPKQGVAYLADGTMVVVDDGQRFVGSDEMVEIEFIRHLQTAAGKMMFAKIISTEIKKKQNKPAGRAPQKAQEKVQEKIQKRAKKAARRNNNLQRDEQTDAKAAEKPKAKDGNNKRRRRKNASNQQ